MSYFDYTGKQIAEVAPVWSSVAATAAGQTLTATSVYEQLKDATGGDKLIGGTGSTDFIVTDPNTVVVQGAHTGVSTVTTWTNFTLPTGVDDLYEEADSMTAIGAAGRENLLVADGAKTVLIGGAGGNDVLVDGGAGSDRFTFAAGGGHEVVYGFQTSGSGQDFLNLSAYGYTSFSQIQSLLSQDGSDTLLTLSGADSILIRNTQVSALTASDFMLALDTSKLTMSFDDEFNSLSLFDPTSGAGTWKTSFRSGVQYGAGSWISRTIEANSEQEIYVDPSYAGSSGGNTALGINPFSISNGVLTITATATPTADLSALDGYKYTSGLLTTQNSFAQTYGYFEMKAELPTGQGVWPAFWLLPEHPSNVDELDVMEAIGGTTTYQTAHWGPAGDGLKDEFANVVPTLSSGFHTYGLLWTAQDLVWYIDGKAVAEMATPAGMNQPMYLLINLAIGGNWPGNAPSSFTSASMEIDYVHAYSLNGSTTTSTSTSTAYTAASSADAPTSTLVETISSAYSYQLPWNFAHTLTLTGSGDLTGSGNNLGDHIIGNTGHDTLIGGLGNDVLDASASGSSVLNGGGGVDTLIGGAANDTFVVANSSDVVTAVAGHQNVLQSSVDFHSPANITTAQLTGSANLALWANSGNETLIANTGADTLYGGAGNDSFVSSTVNLDTMVGGAGSDTFVLNNAADVIELGAGRSTIETPFSYHLPAGVQAGILLGSASLSLWANNGGDKLYANTGDDTIYGGSGNDTFYGGAGADSLVSNGGADSFISGTGVDTLVGGAGSDTYVINNASDVIVLGAGTSTIVTTVSYHLPAGVQTGILSGSASLSLWGDNNGDKLYANAGNDTIYGGSGADTFYGGAGADSFVGGAGADSFISGTGVDTMVGGAGNDSYVVRNSADVIVVGAGSSTVTADVSYRLPTGVHSGALYGSASLSLRANDSGDKLYANAGNDYLVGGSGNDSFISGAGIDTMAGGAGNDTYYVQNSADVITAGAGQNTVEADVGYRLPIGVQIGVLTGSADLSLHANESGDRLYANSGNDYLVGGSGNDSFISGSGVDTMAGGAGNDTYYVQNSSDVITAGSGQNTVQADVSYHLPTNIQIGILYGSANLSLWAHDGGGVLYANAGNDTIYGGSGADTFYGGAGADSLVAGAGNDMFSSGTGVDTMVGGAGSDTYFVQNSADVIVVGTGRTTVTTAVNYHLPDNVQVANLSGSAALSVWAGAGNIQVNANSGADALHAGKGVDSFSAGAGSDTFVFSPGEGDDTVYHFLSGAHDAVDVSAYLNAGYTASLAEVGSNAVISMSNGATITLVGVEASSLTHTTWGYVH